VVRYFVSYAHTDGSLKKELLGRLRPLFASARAYRFEGWQDGDIPLGTDWHERIQAAIEMCDFSLLLVSPAFLASEYIREHELSKFRRVVPVALGLVPLDGSIDLRGLERTQMFLHEGKPFSQYPQGPDKERFVTDLFIKIIHTLKASLPPPLTSEPVPVPAVSAGSAPQASATAGAPSEGPRTGASSLSPGTVFRDLDHPWCPELVVLPQGRFMMGSPEEEPGRFDREGPQHEVVIAYRMAMGRTPVTFAEYDRFCDATDKIKPEDQGWGRDRRPVINVSWQDAQGYVQWLSDQTGKAYRLPSEAEWEYACRAAGSGRWCFGDDEQQLGQYAWFGGNSGGRSQPVGEKLANPFGLYDLHGNVWEWVEDCGHDRYSGAPLDGSAWMSGDNSRRVARGGSWVNFPRGLRAAFRDLVAPEIRDFALGFRVARTLNLDS